MLLDNFKTREIQNCIYCDKHDIAHEYHFILICPCYIDLRKLYIKKYYYVKLSMFKFVELFKLFKMIKEQVL
jgi:hypothetical protein